MAAMALALDFRVWPRSADATQPSPVSRPAASAFSPETPQYPLEGEIAQGWELSQPLWITVDREEDGYFVLSDDLFLVYGEGETFSDALQDYVISLIDYYQLAAAEAKRSPLDQALFGRLRRYLRPAVA